MYIDNRTAEWLADYVKVVGTSNLYNIKTRQFLITTRFNWDLRKQLRKNGDDSVPGTIQKVAIRKGLIPTMTLDEIDAMNRGTVYRFANSGTQTYFVGTREQLCKAYDLDINKLTNIIKRPSRPQYRSWSVSSRNVEESSPNENSEGLV